ncbi:MAG: PepSY-associated TM helix domain-containing protein [Verrucomicrobiota bacterium]
MRPLLFWLHLIIGVLAGIVILIMSVTGALLAYERQILEWADRDCRIAPPAPDAQRLPAESLLARVTEKFPGATPTALTLRADPTAPAAIAFGRERTVYVNPYTGDILGEGSKSWRTFFHVITDWHRWLGAHGENRATGKAITGACNLAFLFLVVSGFYLWWPRTWAALKSVTSFRRGLTGKARDWNWHNVIGFWSAVPLFLIIITGAVISYPWASNLVYRLTGSEPPLPRSAPGVPASQSSDPSTTKRKGEKTKRPDRGTAPTAPPLHHSTTPSPSPTPLHPLLTTAQRHIPGWQTITLRLPVSDTASLTVEQSHRGRPDLRSTLTLDPQSASIVNHETFTGYNLGRRVRTWMRWLHTGEAGGFLGQTLALLASLGASVLVYTGLALTCRRLRAAL